MNHPFSSRERRGAVFAALLVLLWGIPRVLGPARKTSTFQEEVLAYERDMDLIRRRSTLFAPGPGPTPGEVNDLQSRMSSIERLARKNGLILKDFKVLGQGARDTSLFVSAEGTLSGLSQFLQQLQNKRFDIRKGKLQRLDSSSAEKLLIQLTIE